MPVIVQPVQIDPGDVHRRFARHAGTGSRSMQQSRQPALQGVDSVIGTLGGEVITSCDGVKTMPRHQVHRRPQAGTDIVKIDGTV